MFNHVATVTPVTNEQIAERFLSHAQISTSPAVIEICAMAWEFLVTTETPVSSVWARHENLNSLDGRLRRMGLNKRARRWVKQEIQLGLRLPLTHEPQSAYHRDKRLSLEVEPPEKPRLYPYPNTGDEYDNEVQRGMWSLAVRLIEA